MIVKSNLPNDRVALWERHPDHPGGEVFIAGEGEHQVGKTPQVKTLLARGVLIEVKSLPKRSTSSKRSVSRGDSDE